MGRSAKRLAAKESTTLREVVEAGLRLVLKERAARAEPFALRDARVDGRGLSPEVEQAVDQVRAWLESPSLVLLSEEGAYGQRLEDQLRSWKLKGSSIHDARIGAIFRLHGVSELWTADRDFNRLDIAVRNPLV